MDPAPLDLEQQLRRHGDALRQLAGQLVRDANAADDAVQEVWLGALQRPPRDHSALGGWFATALHNVVLMWRRKEQRRANHENTAAAQREVVDRGDRASREEQGKRLLSAIESLDAPFRDAIWARYFEGKAPRAIAAASGVPVATVKSRLQRGLGMLRVRLGEGDRDGDGGRGDWRSAFAVAFGMEKGTAVAASAAVAGGVLMATWMKVAGAIAAAALIAAMLWWPRATGSTPPEASVRDGSVSVSAPSAPLVGAVERSNANAVDEPRGVATPSVPVAGEVSVPGFVHGRVLDIESREPLAGVRVVRGPRGVGEIALETITAADGTFTIEGRVAGQTWIAMRRADRVTVEHRLLVPTGGGVEELGDVLLRAGRTLRGRLVGAEGIAIPAGFLVAVDFDVRFQQGWAELRGEGRADVEGRFVLSEPLPVASTRWSLPFGPVTLEGAPSVVVDVGPTQPEAIVLRVAERPSIRGIVVDETGAPIGSGVMLSEQPGIGHTRVDESGAFTILQMRHGAATPVFVASAPGFEPVPPIPDVPWGTVGLRIVLKRLQPFAIEVVDAEGSPCESFGVAIERPGLDAFSIGAVRQRARHEGGRLLVDDVLRGATRLRVVPMDPEWTPSEALAAGNTQPLRVVLQRRAPVTVVVRSGGTPVPGVAVEMMSECAPSWQPERGVCVETTIVERVSMTTRSAELISRGATDATGTVVLLRDRDVATCALCLRLASAPPVLLRDVAFPAAGEPLLVDFPVLGSLGGRVELSGGRAIDLRVEVLGTQYVGDRALGVDAVGNVANVQLPVGSYVARLQRRLRVFHTLTTQDIVVGRDAPARLHFDLAAFPLASVRGTVRSATPLPANLEVDLIAVDEADAGQVVASARVAADGTFQVAAVAPGTCRAALRTAPLQPQSVPAIGLEQFTLFGGSETAMDLVFAPRRLSVRLQRPNGAPVRGERVLTRCAATTWPALRILTPLVDEVLVFDPAPALPLEFRCWKDGSPWSAPVVMPADRAEAEVTVVLPD